MLETLVNQPKITGLERLQSDIDSACGRIPPVWDLTNYVAVNPFLGFSSESIEEATRFLGETRGAKLLPEMDYYRKRWNAGAFQTTDLARAAQRRQKSSSTLEKILTGKANVPKHKIKSAFTFAEKLDQLHGTSWQAEVSRSAARWCAVHANQGGQHWLYQGDKQSLFTSWCESTRCDHALEILGLKGLRSWMRAIPDQPLEAITCLLGRLPVAIPHREAYFYRLLASLYGWACYYRRQSWQPGSNEPGALVDLLAITLCLDAAVAELAPRPSRSLPVTTPRLVEEEDLRLVCQDALEDRYARDLISMLRTNPIPLHEERPAVQAVFCIDVRSEPLRRHLEEVSPRVETRGFAGFFGVAIDWHDATSGNARCPVLLQPSLPVDGATAPQSKRKESIVSRLQSAPAAAFNFVELMGLTYAFKLAKDALVAGGSPPSSEHSDRLLLKNDTLESRIDLARGILKNLGLRTSFARLVMLCGHEGQSSNNPHAAGLHCGACGGHGGGLNARVAAGLFNDPAVRNGLAEEGLIIPADTHFLPAVHDTTTDRVKILDRSAIPATHLGEVEQLETWLSEAGERVRLERSPALGIPPRKPGLLDRILGRRARDVSEVRPEWGLARNAAFLVARRSRSQGVDLQGRVFLHEYDLALDPDLSVLTMILSAPVVVASWINLQYLASTVDNASFGSGDKTIHNRVGSLGVVLGNGGDLQTGLARQSVHGPDGEWFHEPLRLQVIVEADREHIDAVLARAPQVMELVENGWIRLLALDRDSSAAYLRVAGPTWELVDGKTNPGQNG